MLNDATVLFTMPAPTHEMDSSLPPAQVTDRVPNTCKHVREVAGHMCGAFSSKACVCVCVCVCLFVCVCVCVCVCDTHPAANDGLWVLNPAETHTHTCTTYVFVTCMCPSLALQSQMSGSQAAGQNASKRCAQSTCLLYICVVICVLHAVRHDTT